MQKIKTLLCLAGVYSLAPSEPTLTVELEINRRYLEINLTSDEVAKINEKCDQEKALYKVISEKTMPVLAENSIECLSTFFMRFVDLKMPKDGELTIKASLIIEDPSQILCLDLVDKERIKMIPRIGLIKFLQSPGPGHLPLKELLKGNLQVIDVIFIGSMLSLGTIPEEDPGEFYQWPNFDLRFLDFLQKVKDPILQSCTSNTVQMYLYPNVFAALCMLHTEQDVIGIEKNKEDRDISPVAIEIAQEILKAA